MMWATEGWKCSTNLSLSLISTIDSLDRTRQTLSLSDIAMQRLSHQTRCFDGFTLDLTRGCLLRGAQEIKLRPKPFEALKYLLENPGRLINKAELMHVLWPDTAVTDDSLVQCLI